jgi:hypothetical protein
MPGARQLPRDEPAAQPAADDGKVRPMRCPRRAGTPVDKSIHDAMPPQRRAAAREEVTGKSVPSPLSSAADAQSKDEISGETGGVAQCQGPKADGMLEETGKTMAFSGNFPRRYYPDRVQRVSLSLVARFVLRETRAKHPCFVDDH